MKSVVFYLFSLAFVGTSLADAVQSAVTPVQKVTQLLQGMLEKGKKEKHEEQIQFASYKQFCDDTMVEKQRAIKEAGQAIDSNNADIQKYGATVERLTKLIAEADEDISIWSGDIKAATKVRQIEKADYQETHKDYTESVDALERAITVLKKQAHDRKQKSSFVQVAALQEMNLIPPEAKRTLDTFFQSVQDSDLEVEGPPEANAYEFQSQGVVDMLSKLLDKFIDERSTLEQEEKNSKHAYDMLMMDLKEEIAQTTKGRDSKAEAKAKNLQAKADTSGELQDTSASKAADEKYLKDLSSECTQKSSEFESRQQLRGEEIEAIEKAIEICASDAIHGNSEKHFSPHEESLMQRRWTFAQLRSNLQTQAQARVVQHLRSQATKLNSRVLAAVAAHAADDPFNKVKKMIKDLITRLMEEANEEAEHKGWCDTELSTNAQTRKEKTDAVETLRAEIDQLEASISTLSDDIGELTRAVSELDEAMAKATAIRSEEKAHNKEAMDDAQAAQAAVSQAMIVLKEFYAKAGEATAFVQQSKRFSQKQPEIFDESYKGMQSENGGVIGMLEVIEADFARLESESKAEEAINQKLYDEFMTDSKVDKSEKRTDIEHKTANKQDQSQALTTKKGDLEGIEKELDAALVYFDKLKPSCVDAGVSYEDRVARRKEEIESLQEALKILNGESI